jgi:hypothetical protein
VHFPRYGKSREPSAVPYRSGRVGYPSLSLGLHMARRLGPARALAHRRPPFAPASCRFYARVSLQRGEMPAAPIGLPRAHALGSPTVLVVLPKYRCGVQNWRLLANKTPKTNNNENNDVIKSSNNENNDVITP